MLVSTKTLLHAAQNNGYAIGAFNVYNLEGVRAVVGAAEREHSPAMLQIHPSALEYGGQPLAALCLAAAQHASVPVSVHLDHSASAAAIRMALDAGIKSVMADGSHLPYEQNVAFTRDMVNMVHGHGGVVEAELGRLTGTEDGLTVPEYESRLTDPEQAAAFVHHTGIDALAVCIGNVHGRYRTEPHFDWERLALIRRAVDVALVLHGASGVPDQMVRHAITLGVCKFNVNTELREAYLNALRTSINASDTPDLLNAMQAAVAAMEAVVRGKLRLFGSTGQG